MLWNESIIDLVILPPFAKFIFNIDYDIKKIIIDIIEICIKRDLVYINKQKCFNFLNNFYFFDGNLKFNAEIVCNLLQIKDIELLKGNNYDNENNNYYGGIPNNITEQIFDFNKKIKEFLNESKKKLEKMKENENQNEKICDDNNIPGDEMLNKKRKKEKEEEEEEKESENEKKNERKGNKKKFGKNKNKKKEKNKNENNNKNNEVEDDDKQNNALNNDENESLKGDKLNENKKEEEMQIDEDIDIPDII